jgi:hypothetical protein
MATTEFESGAATLAVQDKFFDMGQVAFLGDRLVHGPVDYSTIIPNSAPSAPPMETGLDSPESAFDLRDAIMARLDARDELGMVNLVGYAQKAEKAKRYFVFGVGVVALGLAAGLIGGMSGLIPKAGGHGELSIGEITTKAGKVTIGHEECWIKELQTEVVVPVDYKFTTTASLPSALPGIGGTHDLPGTTKKWGETMHANYGVKVCNEAADMTTRAGKDGKIHVAFKDDLAISATAYQINPMETTYEESNNPLADFSEGVQSMVSAVPLLPNVKNIATGKDFLKGVAQTVGGSTAAEAVAPKVFAAAEPEMVAEIQKETYKQFQSTAKALDGTVGFKATDIVVEMPNHPTFTDPYGDIMDKLEARNGVEKDHFTLDFTAPDYSKVKVDMSDLKIVTEQ